MPRLVAVVRRVVEVVRRAAAVASEVARDCPPRSHSAMPSAADGTLRPSWRARMVASLGALDQRIERGSSERPNGRSSASASQAASSSHQPPPLLLSRTPAARRSGSGPSGGHRAVTTPPPAQAAGGADHGVDAMEPSTVHGVDRRPPPSPSCGRGPRTPFPAVSAEAQRAARLVRRVVVRHEHGRGRLRVRWLGSSVAVSSHSVCCDRARPTSVRLRITSVASRQ